MQYKWMYLFERLGITFIINVKCGFLNFLFQWIHVYVYLHAGTCLTSRKKIKNKTHVDSSICAAYIIEEISIFISYYFEPHMWIRINCVLRHDDGGEISSGGNVSIFSNFRWSLSKNTASRRYLTNIELKKKTHNYMLFNYNELRPFV